MSQSSHVSYPRLGLGTDLTRQLIQSRSSPNFPTIDPAPASTSTALAESIPTLRNILLDTFRPLFERYRAMFALRDYGAGSKEAVQSLADGFADSSALFR